MTREMRTGTFEQALKGAAPASGQEGGLPISAARLKNTVSMVDALARFVDQVGGTTRLGATAPALLMGAAIRNARRIRGLKQEELAAASGIPQSTISEIETGRGVSGPNVLTLSRLANALDLDLALLPRSRSHGPRPDSATEPVPKMIFVRSVSGGPGLVETGREYDVAGIRNWLDICLDPDVVFKVHNEMIALCKDKKQLQNDMIASRSGAFQLWRLAARDRGDLANAVATIVVQLRGSGKLQSRSPIFSYDVFYVCRGNDVVSVENVLDSPLTFASIPVTRFLEACELNHGSGTEPR